MNKTELIAAMAEESGLTKTDTEKALNAFVHQVEAALKAGEKIQLTGFGSNPRTKEEVKIPASKAPVFKAGKPLKDALN